VSIGDWSEAGFDSMLGLRLKPLTIASTNFGTDAILSL
jgi:hypothetical protein